MKILFKKLFYLLPAILIYNQALAQSSLYQSPCSELIWADEFDGTTLDASKWTPQIGDGCPDLCGWGNAELEYYTDRTENVKVENGKLIITSIKESYAGSDYTSGRIRTINKGDFTFGRIESRIKLPKGAGSWSAFWMLPTDNVYGAWAASGEIDIMEFQGHTPNMVSGTIHYGSQWPNNKYLGAVYSLPSGNFYDDFHTYAIEWDSTTIRWYMDDINYITRTKAEIAPNNWPFSERFHIILNNAVGGYLGHTPDDSFFPMTMEVDYVRVYTNPLTRTLHGKQKMLVGQTSTYFLASDNLDLTYTWTIPSDATIVSGQGTKAITVQWGPTSGDVSVDIGRACGTLNLKLPVKVYSDNACTLVFNDFDTNKNINKSTTSNSLVEVANPAPDAVNGASQIGKYRRSASAKDSIVYDQLIPLDYSKFESAMKSFYMDVYTGALPGTSIEIHLRNHEKSLTGPYPIGTRSIYRAYTSLQNKWEKLKFVPVTVNESEVDANEIDEIAIFLDPNLTSVQSTATRLYYLDNFIISRVPADTITGPSTVGCQSTGNPFSVHQQANVTYNWQVPAAATLVSGQNTNQVTLNWGSTSGNLSIVKTLDDGCSAISAQVFVKASCTTATTTPIESLNVKIYPNPTRDNVLIEGSKPFNEVVLLNSIGKEVYHQSLSSSSVEISLSNLPDGIYFIKLKNAESVALEKIIKGQ